MKNSRIGRWVTPLGGNMAGDRRPQFSPDEFVRGTDTLYPLSKEGEGTAAPLVTALTVAVVEAGERPPRRSTADDWGRRCCASRRGRERVPVEGPP
ncbi:hypothetical protein [Curtobacterium sp. MCPF17_046]|uniref:hypothetical protein n=1 Tax=Curtobacterium sp. MCPF17_046 TaxID=2175663 RepID=UPI0021ABB8DA|nr:hypothetical protein [Curtobacterium sp. MCPF17_046]